MCAYVIILINVCVCVYRKRICSLNRMCSRRAKKECVLYCVVESFEKCVCAYVCVYRKRMCSRKRLFPKLCVLKENVFWRGRRGVYPTLCGQIDLYVCIRTCVSKENVFSQENVSQIMFLINSGNEFMHMYRKRMCSRKKMCFERECVQAVWFDEVVCVHMYLCIARERIPNRECVLHTRVTFASCVCVCVCTCVCVCVCAWCVDFWL